MAQKKYVSLEKLSLYDEKIKKVISDGDAATLASAITEAEKLGVNYDVAGAAATVQEKLDEEVTRAKAKEDELVVKDTALQKEIDDLETLVGVLPETSSSTDIVGYVQEKTSGIATSENLAELTNRVAQAETDIDNIEKDYLKTVDKTELADAISAEQTRAEGIEAGLRTDIDAIKGDYLKATDKTELQGNIDTVSETLADVKADVDAFFADADMTESAKDTLKELQTYIASDETAASEMLASIQQNGKDIDAVEGRLDAVEPKVTTLEGEMDNAQAAISALQGAVGDGGSVKDMIDGAIETAVSEEATRVDGELAKKVDKVDGKGLSTNDLTNELKGQYDASYAHSQEVHAPADAQKNVIETVKVNGTAVTVTDKAVDIFVPTDNAQLTNGAKYLVAADIANKADKATTLAGYGIADAYTSAQTDTAIANAVGQFVEVSEEEINQLFA